jgi:diguanylate cyclase (GGDEF)-like protein/PAS domain S-box-containing protein
MKFDAPEELGDSAEEIAGLIGILQATEKRLDELTAGQVDSVMDSHGGTYLLKHAQEFLRRFEDNKQAAILDAFPALIALLDIRGFVVSVNEAWRQTAAANGFQGPREAVGAEYAAACVAAGARNPAVALQVADGIRAVLAGARKSFVTEYPCESRAGDRWFLMMVMPLSRDTAGGAIVMHIDVTEERRAESELKISESRFRQMAESMSDVFFLSDVDSHRFFYVSPSYEKIWGHTCDSLHAHPGSWAKSIHPDDREPMRRQFAADPRAGVDCEYRLMQAEGSMRWIQLRTFPVLGADGVPYRTAGVATDVTARKLAESRVDYLNRVHAMLGGINMLIVRARDRSYLFAEACRISVEDGGFPMCWIGIVDPRIDRIVPVASRGLDEAFLAELRARLPPAEGGRLGTTLTARALRGRKPIVSNDSQSDPHVLFGAIHAKNGVHSIAVLPLVINDRSVGVLALYAREMEFFHEDEMKLLTQLAGDIAFAIDHIENQDRLEYIAFYDPLTGLANQRLFLDRAAHYVRSAAAANLQLAICLIDLEHFKNFNDTYGQAAGDGLLQQVAVWMTEELGGANIVARIGPDRFAVVIPIVTGEDELAELLEEKLLLFMEHPFRLNESVIRIAAKIGISVFPEDGTDAEMLFRNAEAALKKAKAGGDRYLFFAQKMTETVAGRMTLIFRLRHALDNDEFVLHYQPKLDFSNRRVIGAEALLRWQDPRTGLVAPGLFIPILEDTGLIFDVGRWAVRQALSDYLRWRRAGLSAVRVAVNVSPLQLRNRNFLADIQQLLAVDPDAAEGLELEITESVIMQDVGTTITSLKALHAMGVKVAIDDFGTGFSSLSYLAKLPVDTLKIDQSFVSDMIGGPEGLSLVSTIINLAHSLKLNVVAEGVETEEQFRLLRLLGCDQMQGYLISKPLPVDLFESRFLTAV